MARASLLIVEDNPAQQYVFKQLCERFGFDAIIVGTGEEALGALGLAQYAAVILDINLPGINGVDTVRALRNLERGTVRRTPVIAVTANVGPEHRAECIAAGMDDYLGKPFSIDSFRKTLLRWTYDARRPNLMLITSIPEEQEQLFG